MANFNKGFTDTFKSGLAIGSSAAEKSIAEKVKKNAEEDAKASKLASVRKEANEGIEMLAKLPQIPEEIKNYGKTIYEDSLDDKDPDRAFKKIDGFKRMVQDMMKKSVPEAQSVEKRIQSYQNIIANAPRTPVGDATVAMAEANIRKLQGGSYDEPINPQKPQIRNPDGTVSTEKTIGIEVDGKHVNIPTIVNGKELSKEDAISAYKMGINDPVGVFDSREEADSAAKKRTVAIGEKIQGSSGESVKFGSPDLQKRLSEYKPEYDSRGIQTAQSILKEKMLAKQLDAEQSQIDKVGEDRIKAERGSLGAYRFVQQFGRSYRELKKFDKDIDKQGFGGWLTRKKAEVANAFDELPETKALNIRILPMANAMAREIEGGRVTDDDRKIYADSFANALKEPSITNVRLLSSSMVDMIDKGGNESGALTKQLKQLAEQDIDILNDTIEQVLIEFPDLVEGIYGEGAEIVE